MARYIGYLCPHPHIRAALVSIFPSDRYLAVVGIGIEIGRSALSSIPVRHARSRVVIRFPAVLSGPGMIVWVLVEIRMIRKEGGRHDNVTAT